jgi:hypothetical protein
MEEAIKQFQAAMKAAMETQMQKQMLMFKKIAEQHVSQKAAAVAGDDIPITPTLANAVTPPPSPSLPKRRTSPRLRNRKVKIEREREREGKPLKRSLSFEQAVGRGSRQKKSKEDHQLRTELRMRLCVLDSKLFKGVFHYPGTNKFVLPFFFVVIAVCCSSVLFFFSRFLLLWLLCCPFCCCCCFSLTNVRK